MRRHPFTVAVALVAACGGAPPTPEVEPVPQMAVETIAGLRLATIPRSTPGLVHLALFVDAGSRDASPPQLATLAAWAAGPDLSPRVLPDGTSFERSCESDALGECTRSLAAALGARGIGGAPLDSLRERLVARRRGAGADDGRAADLLALRALLGDEAEAFSPLGREEDDDALTAPALGAFHAEHYGPRRATLVAAGDVAGAELRDAIRVAFTGAPPALGARAERSLEASEGPRLRVRVGDVTSTTAVMLAGSGSLATTLARALADDAALRSTAGPRLVVHGFPIRGGGLVSARITGVRPASAGRALVSALGRAAVERSRPSPMTLPTDPREAAMILGTAWIGSDEATGDEGVEARRVAPNDEGDALAVPPPAIAIGVGSVVAGGRGDRVSEDAPDTPVRTRALRHLTRAVEQAWAELSPALRGELTPSGAAVSLVDNGARIDVVRRPADTRVAVAVRFLGGGSADPPSLHGRAALLAELSATGCGGLTAPALREALRELGAEIGPLVDADTHGVVLAGPREHANALIDLAMSCAFDPSVERSDLVDARIRAIARVDRLQSVAATAIAAEAPGIVAPRGSVGTIQSVSLPALTRELAASRVGARTSVAVVGSVDVEDALARVARSLSALPEGTLPASPPALAPGSPGRIVPFEIESETPRVVFAMLAGGPDRPDADRAAAFAAEIARTLTRGGDVRVVSILAGASRGTTWLAVAADVPEELLAAIPERVRGAVVSAAPERMEEAALRAERESRWRDAEPAAVAARRCRERLVGPPPGGRDPRRFGAPAFAIGRPR